MMVKPIDDPERLAAHIMREVMERNLLMIRDVDDDCDCDCKDCDGECEDMKVVYWNVHAFEQLSALIRDVIG